MRSAVMPNVILAKDKLLQTNAALDVHVLVPMDPQVLGNVKGASTDVTTIAVRIFVL